MRAKAPYSIQSFFLYTVYSIDMLYTLWLLLFKHKECPMRNRDIVICFFVDFLKAGFHGTKVGSIIVYVVISALLQFCMENLLILYFV